MSSAPDRDMQMEQAVLGAMMLSAAARADCLELLTPHPGPAVFFRPAHQIVFEVIAALDDDGQPVDALTVKAELEHRKMLQKVAGADYLHTLLAAVPAPANAASYVRELLRIHAGRSLGTAGTRIRQLAQESPALDAGELAERATQILDEATGQVASGGTGTPVSQLIGPFLDALQAGPDTTKGIMTGWRDVDQAIPGLRPGELVIVGARPSMGKSIVLLNVATRVGISQQVPVLVCSLEMSRDECMERLVSSVAGVDLSRIRDRVLAEQDWDRIAKVHHQISEAEWLVINDDPDLTVQGIRAELRAMRRAGMPAQMVIVDYLQLMEGSGRPESRQLEVSGVARSLKKLAKEFGVPVLAGSQLSRGPEQRSDHRPLLADLRESGALEQDSDIVILLYRDDAYVQESPHSGEIDLIIAKNRQGPRTTAQLAFRGHYAMCADLYRQEGLS